MRNTFLRLLLFGCQVPRNHMFIES